MPNFVPSITVDDVIEALGAFLSPFVGTTEIIRAQVNRVAMPPGSCVVLTELLTVDLETPNPVESGVTTTLTGPRRIDVQIDFYGPNSGDQCNAVKGVYRSSYAPAQFPDGIKPLYCSDGHQAPLITAEQQYESRWTITATLQYNPAVSIPRQSANTLTVATTEDLQ